MIFSCIIPASAKDAESQNLKGLISSIKAQDFPQDQIEILVITEGDSEQAKAIGIKRAKGEICVMFCADNMITYDGFFWAIKNLMARGATGVYFKRYAYLKEDNSLNRYFSLLGGNDVISYYLGKNDRKPFYELSEEEVVTFLRFKKIPSLGCNGFAFKRSLLLEYVDLDHYYPMDAAQDLVNSGLNLWARINDSGTWHRTSDNLLTFLKKRYRYARDLYSDRQDRRWKMVDTTHDKWMLAWFVFSVLTVIPCLCVSIRGYAKVHDLAWFWHYPVSLSFLLTYGLLALRNLLKYGRLFQCAQASSSQVTTVKPPLSAA